MVYQPSYCNPSLYYSHHQTAQLILPNPTSPHPTPTLTPIPTQSLSVLPSVGTMSFSDMVKLGTQASGAAGVPSYPQGMMTAPHLHPGAPGPGLGAQGQGLAPTFFAPPGASDPNAVGSGLGPGSAPFAPPPGGFPGQPFFLPPPGPGTQPMNAPGGGFHHPTFQPPPSAPGFYPTPLHGGFLPPPSAAAGPGLHHTMMGGMIPPTHPPMTMMAPAAPLLDLHKVLLCWQCGPTRYPPPFPHHLQSLFLIHSHTYSNAPETTSEHIHITSSLHTLRYSLPLTPSLHTLSQYLLAIQPHSIHPRSIVPTRLTPFYTSIQHTHTPPLFLSLLLSLPLSLSLSQVSVGHMASVVKCAIKGGHPRFAPLDNTAILSYQGNKNKPASLHPPTTIHLQISCRYPPFTHPLHTTHPNYILITHPIIYLINSPYPPTFTRMTLTNVLSFYVSFYV